MSGYEQVVRQHQDRVYSYAYYALGSREEAEDIAQDVFIRLWNHWNELDQQTVTGWIIRVSRNACLDKLRQRQTRTALLHQHAKDIEQFDVPRDSISSEDQELRRQIQTAIRELEEPYRSIVILREIDELTYEAIATSLVMPLNTVKVYLHRARKMLRDKLKGVRANESA